MRPFLIFNKMMGTVNCKWTMNNIKENIVLAFFVGLFLGAISIFLAIGGGPLNVSLFVIIFHFTMKQSSVYSIATIFFSQITKIISIVASAQYQMFDMKMIPMLIILQLLAVILVQFGTRKFHQQNWKVFIQFSWLLLQQLLDLM